MTTLEAFSLLQEEPRVLKDWCLDHGLPVPEVELGGDSKAIWGWGFGSGDGDGTGLGSGQGHGRGSGYGWGWGFGYGDGYGDGWVYDNS